MHSESEHSFDWTGFKFVCKSALIFSVLFAVCHYGPLYYESWYISSHIVAAELSAPVPVAHALTVSTTTPVRVINSLTIPEVVPAQGKFIVADLVHMRLTLYMDGSSAASYPILTKGKPGSPYETPSGVYEVLTKERDHYNSVEEVHMPYSMEFYGNYFIHGWPTYNDGSPVASTYSGGCIRLSTADAQKVYSFADPHTGVFVYDTGAQETLEPLVLRTTPVPPVSARSYLVADIDTGSVYAEREAETPLPIASLTKLMTALVANETIMFDRPITVPRGELKDAAVPSDTAPRTFVVGDLLYPLLMESNNKIADTLAAYYGPSSFVKWMNSQAAALGMSSTTYADPSGVSADNSSTAEDLYRLAVYLSNKKSFVWQITSTPHKTIAASGGERFSYDNFNIFSGNSAFIGGKVGHTTAAADTMISIFSVPAPDQSTHRVAIIVLGSENYTDDSQALLGWLQSSVTSAQTACVACGVKAAYRQITP